MLSLRPQLEQVSKIGELGEANRFGNCEATALITATWSAALSVALILSVDIG
ncbi:MAG: hypothetical protein KME43_02535 [Myxacorys chilensis ATA2-1-KO14]|jgi:hypothetical protein|nr:hypothetical protein [Myxacorys chilensis ATA2-1-KO14]